MRTWFVVLALLLVPAAAAHGAPEPRELDVRLLVDATQLDYGGPEGVASAGGRDLLALDVFEGTVPGTATPALVFRIIATGGDPGVHRIDLHAQAGGQDITLSWHSDDLETYTSSTFDAVRGPFLVGDGHQDAVEGYIALATLGLDVGDAITGIRVTSHYDGEPQDVMPGGWYFMGQAIPVPPTDDEGEPAAYTTKGPARFFTTATDTSVFPAMGETRVVVNLTSMLDSLDQELTLTAAAPSGINVSFANDIVPLDAQGSATAAFTVSGAGIGSVQILIQSDLGSAVQLVFPLKGEGGEGTGGDVDSGDILPGDSYQYTFTAAGTFEYHCHPHPWMIAEIEIQDTNSTPRLHVVRMVEGTSSDDWGFDPQQFTISVGDTVLWVNEGQEIHNVMGSTGIGGHGHHHDHDHDHGDHGEDKDTPAPLILIPLAIALWVARRRN